MLPEEMAKGMLASGSSVEQLLVLEIRAQEEMEALIMKDSKDSSPSEQLVPILI